MRNYQVVVRRDKDDVTALWSIEANTIQECIEVVSVELARDYGTTDSFTILSIMLYREDV